jgi:DNA repair exonuclease SbcCD ATPase subunit
LSALDTPTAQAVKRLSSTELRRRQAALRATEASVRARRQELDRLVQREQDLRSALERARERLAILERQRPSTLHRNARGAHAEALRVHGASCAGLSNELAAVSQARRIASSAAVRNGSPVRPEARELALIDEELQRRSKLERELAPLPIVLARRR